MQAQKPSPKARNGIKIEDNKDGSEEEEDDDDDDDEQVFKQQPLLSENFPPVAPTRVSEDRLGTAHGNRRNRIQ